MVEWDLASKNKNHTLFLSSLSMIVERFRASNFNQRKGFKLG